jgi:hypothetical protein
MNTHDWLRNLPISDLEEACRVVGSLLQPGQPERFLPQRNAAPF